MNKGLSNQHEYAQRFADCVKNGVQLLTCFNVCYNPWAVAWKLRRQVWKAGVKMWSKLTVTERQQDII